MICPYFGNCGGCKFQDVEYKQQVENKLKIIETRPNSRERSQIFHLAHASSYDVTGNISELVRFVNDFDKIDLDLGVISFNPINPQITSDRRSIISEQKGNGLDSVVRSAIELEGDSFVKLRTLSKKNPIHSRIWKIIYIDG